MKLTITIDDELAAEVEQRAGDRTWSEIVTDCLVFALTQADAEQYDEPTSPDHPTNYPEHGCSAHTDNADSTPS